MHNNACCLNACCLNTCCLNACCLNACYLNACCLNACCLNLQPHTGVLSVVKGYKNASSNCDAKASK